MREMRAGVVRGVVFWGGWLVCVGFFGLVWVCGGLKGSGDGGCGCLRFVASRCGFGWSGAIAVGGDIRGGVWCHVRRSRRKVSMVQGA